MPGPLIPEADWERRDAWPAEVPPLVGQVAGTAPAVPVGGGLIHPTYRVGDVAVRLTDRWALEASVQREVAGVVPTAPLVTVVPGAVVTRWVDGVRWAERLATGASAYRAAFDAGQVLARLHRETGDRPVASLLADDQQPVAPFALGAGWASFLRERARGAEGLLAVVREHESRIAALGPPYALLHGDYKPTNLLLGPDDQVAAVLDWEFAWWGSPWSDVGQLLRWADRYPADFVPGFVDGYAPAHPDWRELAALLDLLNLVTFLGDPERPNVQRDARERIERTMSLLGG